jgi:putative ABC transport system permease protein
LLDTSFGISESKLAGEVKEIVDDGDLRHVSRIADDNAGVIRDSFLSVIAMLMAIGLFVGTTVIGITIYSATVEKAREYGVLKAVGIKSTRLYAIVFEQALISSVAGFILGVLLYHLVAWLAYNYFPEVVFYLSIEYYLYVLILAVVMSIIAAFIPIKKINDIDPALVFKS